MPIPYKPPEILDPKNKSVFDSPIVKGLRAVSSFLGGDDPASQVMGAVGPTPLVSIYNNPETRQAGTELFKKTMNELGPSLGEAGEWLAKRWPRVAAHIKPSVESILPGIGAETHTPVGKVTDPIKVVFNKSAQLSNIGTRGTLAHEAIHVAQALGNSKNRDLYDAANLAVGYDKNPLEITARTRGRSSVRGNYKVRQTHIAGEPKKVTVRLHPRVVETQIPNVPYTAIRGLKKIAESPKTPILWDQFPASSSSMIAPEPEMPLEVISGLLKARGLK